VSSETSPATRPAKTQQLLVWLGLAIILCGIAAYCYPVYFSALTRSGRAIYTYSLDSFVLLSQVETAFNAPRFHLEFTDYGQLYFNIAIALTALYSLFAHPTDGAIYFFLQIAALAGGLLTVGAIFLFSRRFFGDLIALFCAATMALAPVFLSWCVEAHPDTWQMFFASLSVFLCVLSYPARDTSRSGEQLKVRPLLGAAAAAGAAFSTKYIGVLLLPLLFATALAAPIPAISEEEAERTKRQLSTAATILIVPSLFFGMLLNPSRTLRLFPSWHALPPDTLASFVLLTRGGCFLLAVFSLVMVIACRTGLGVTKYAGIAQRILLLLAILAAFFLTFGLTSPWAAWRLAFVPSVYTMGAYVNFGHGVKADVYGLRWLTTLAEPKVIGPAAAALALAGLAAVTWQWKCAHFRLWQAPLAILAAWAVFFAAFLILRVNLAKDYYLFPMIPATIVLAGAGIAKLREWLASRLSRDAAQKITAVIMVAILAAQAWTMIPIVKVQAFPQQMAPAKEAVGKWLLACVPRDTRIMSAAYAYIPPDFANASLNTDQGSFARLTEYRPSLVILDASDIVYFEGSLDNSALNLLGDAKDKVQYFNAVAHSPGWLLGPKIGNYRIFMKSQLHDQIAQSQKSCSGS